MIDYLKITGKKPIKRGMVMNGNEISQEDHKSRARAFSEKALSDLKKSNYVLAEFYLQAAVKEDPENQEYKEKLDQVQKALAREKEEAEQAEARKVPLPDSDPQALFAPDKPRAEKKPEKAAKKGPRLFGIPVKNLNTRAIYSTLGILLGIAVAYSVYATLTKQDARANIADIKKIYGIELKSASVGEGKFQGFITEAWNAVPREEREKKVKRLFQDFRKSRGIKTLVLWDENFSAVAEASVSGVNISP